MRAATVVFSINRSVNARVRSATSTLAVEGRPCINGSDVGIRPSSHSFRPFPSSLSPACVMAFRPNQGPPSEAADASAGAMTKSGHQSGVTSGDVSLPEPPRRPASLSRPPPHPSAVPANPRQYTASMHHCTASPQSPDITTHKERDRAARKWTLIFPLRPATLSNPLRMKG